MTTLEHSQLTLFDETELPSMSSAAAFPVRISRSLESALALKVRDLVCGVNTGGSLANYDRALSSWRTCQACLVSGWEPFSETWPRSGTMQRGTAYQLPPSAPLTGETASGSWPTPAASVTNLTESPESWQARADRLKAKGINGNGAGVPLTVAVKMWPTSTSSLGTKGGRVTPRKSREGGTLIEAVSMRTWRTPSPAELKVARNGSQGQTMLSHQVGGLLNPTWVEWLMAFPLGWTALKDSATPSCLKLLKSSGEQS